jgi:aconitase A
MSARTFFDTRAQLQTSAGTYDYARIDALQDKGIGHVQRLPYSIRVLLESCLRNHDDFIVNADHIKALASYNAKQVGEQEIPFSPGRVVLQDFTGVPAVVDFAALRSAMARMGGDVQKVNPLIRADLVIDHSVQVDAFGSPQAMKINTGLEFERNRERYEFLKWGQGAFSNFSVVPPETGIVHQVNLEYLASAVLTQDADGTRVAYPDSLVGTDSHTTMINGLGVVGWGVGGIEAEACMLGQPIYMLIPEVIGFKLKGRLREGATATDLVLTVTQMLRKRGVVEKFVEFFGPGLADLSLADRATIANMAPEYGATIGFFPIDDRTLEYMRLTGRSDDTLALVEAYAKAQGLWRDDAAPIEYTDTLELDLADVQPSLAGPRRPQDRVILSEMQGQFQLELKNPKGFNHPTKKVAANDTSYRDATFKLEDGAVVIAAITSCTNTSNPSVLIAAGLVARKAHALGLKAKPWVKTSLAPGSRVVTDYLDSAGLSADLEAVGFYTVGYGCAVCVAEGSLVSLSDGTARPIESFMQASGARLLSPDASTQRLTFAPQTQAFSNGEADCVEVTLQDGRTLTCTPDHQLLLADGRFVAAGKLRAGTDRVLVGPDAPADLPAADEAGYTLRAGSLSLRLADPTNRAKALAFCRLLGFTLGNGSISNHGQGRVCAGQAMDREALLDDVQLLTGKRPIANMYDERKWSVVLPKDLTQAFLALDGVYAGNRFGSATVPAMFSHPSCPAALIREFVAGHFGADGWAPRMSSDQTLTPPILMHAARAARASEMHAFMSDMAALLSRCGVDMAGHTIRQYPVRYAASSYRPKDDAPRVEVRLTVPDGLGFVERVGYRYSVQKRMVSAAAATRWRTVRKIGEQRLAVADQLRALHAQHPQLPFSKARAQVAAAFQAQEVVIHPHYALLHGLDRFDRLPTSSAFKPLHQESAGFPSMQRFMDEVGASAWFKQLRDDSDASNADNPNAKRYINAKDDLSTPTLSLGVLAVRPAGRRQVYDLTVEGTHAFIANGVCVHNCIGNSGPLDEPIADAITQNDLVAAAVLSGNRNFEGRVSPHTRANYLASPPLVVAYALAGTVDIDLYKDPIGTSANGQPVFMKDIWPSNAEIQALLSEHVTREQFVNRYSDVFSGPDAWRALPAPSGEVFTWDQQSTYVQEPPFFVGMSKDAKPIQPIQGAKVLAKLGHSVTTDHISPAGNISKSSPAARFLLAHGVEQKDFNSYGSRRGNDRVMTRGTFANIRLKNDLADGKEGGFTKYLGPDADIQGPVPGLPYDSDISPKVGEICSIYDASVKYQKHGVKLAILAGKDYGMGSSRDWAAKGTFLLGVRFVLAESYERIHRSNLIGMGVLPLQYKAGDTAESLGLKGDEAFDVAISDDLKPLQDVQVTATAPDGSQKTFAVRCRIDTPVEVVYYRNGGILHTVLRRLVG